MKENKYSKLSAVVFLFLIFLLTSCTGFKNLDRPIPDKNETGSFVTVRDGTKIFVYEYVPGSDFKNTIYIISGITGINHKSEKDIIEKLSNNQNRVVVIHPRGTGYSEGNRGDIRNFSDLIEDYVEVIKGDRFYRECKGETVLFGHSMSSAIALIIANELVYADGLIMVNPPYKLKKAEGMTPGAGDYLRYAFYSLFAPHVPIVNMAGDPSAIAAEDDRKESVARNNDPLLVKYFSMHYMIESKRIMDGMVKNAQQADYPMLLLYGDNDMIVDKAGCDEIYSSWKNTNKNYKIIKGGSHGESTVLKGAGIINKWIEGI